jgi:hypothetical protein
MCRNPEGDPRPQVAEPMGLPLLFERMNLLAMPRD